MKKSNGKQRTENARGVPQSIRFAVAIEQGTKTTAFGVVVPDLPGCFSAGDSIEEAIENARQAIRAHCEMLSAEGKEVPLPRPLTEWQQDPAFKGWTWDMIDAGEHTKA